ncbi:unnamed protein product [Mycena citricolor]|uniref:Methyltransferase domain-containing protein n=1 Tax=Mycena citricolor TaxID=2018698 RepID=A0AAD2H153_9AGAR|nr:unnamed protein product [Mycena citricolor]
MAAPGTTSSSRYVLPAVSAEKERLERQYHMTKTIYGWKRPVPNCVDLSAITNVIDVATGTGIWSFDMAAHCHSTSRRPVRVYACDINPAILPSQQATEPWGIQAFVHNVTTAFPEHLHAKFDLVHMSFLALCLTEPEWEMALDNCRSLLKPDGILILKEIDPICLSEDQYAARMRMHNPALDDLHQYLRGPDWKQLANRFYTEFALKNEFVVGLSHRLPKMLARAGFALANSHYAPLAVGSVCRSRVGATGLPLAEYDALTTANLLFILRHTARSMLERGIFPEDIDPGRLEDVLDEVRAGLDSEGCLVPAFCLVARRS